MAQEEKRREEEKALTLTQSMRQVNIQVSNFSQLETGVHCGKWMQLIGFWWSPLSNGKDTLFGRWGKFCFLLFMKAQLVNATNFFGQIHDHFVRKFGICLAINQFVCLLCVVGIKKIKYIKKIGQGILLSLLLSLKKWQFKKNNFININTFINVCFVYLSKSKVFN